MDTSTSSYRRSRRRRTSFALFGRQRQRDALADILPAARWRYEERALETVPSDEAQPNSPATPEVDARQAEESQAIVARLQREARADHRLTSLTGPDLDRLIEQTVRSLWAESRVTAFVPLLAMRRIHEELGLDDEPSARRESS